MKHVTSGGSTLVREDQLRSLNHSVAVWAYNVKLARRVVIDEKLNEIKLITKQPREAWVKLVNYKDPNGWYNDPYFIL